ncbi:MAG: FHA domain-containing protein [Chitinophaga sp.]|uniref:FHA domain-containing protein n=1 Tax=Chitinophaga sp. TaxID=1869181 RepID=UPI0025C2848F|nr:FHA domain-containing protein [Chitinophaga sp.]MBV8251869.1 FHA domain-containing protein [Chitinophaga sp.]
MASIHNLVTDELIVPTPLFTVGRNPVMVNLYLPFNDVSQAHATIFWSKDGWYLRDYSRNGTLIDGQHVWNRTVKLFKQHIIQFGADAQTRWKVTDLEPPFPFLKSVHRKNQIIRLSFATALPDRGQHDATIYFLPEKGWVYERGGSVNTLMDGTTIQYADDEWEFVAIDELEDTIVQHSVKDTAVFNFHLSLNEEHIRLELALNEYTSLDLGSRSHNYLLLSLARKRYEDRLLSLANADQGWCLIDEVIADVSRELRKEVDVYFLNLQIFRLRKQLCEIPDVGYLFNNIIERRPGEIRLGHPYFTIQKGDQIEADVQPFRNQKV